VLQFVAQSVAQCVPVTCSCIVLHCVALCYGAFKFVTVCFGAW